MATLVIICLIPASLGRPQIPLFGNDQSDQATGQFGAAPTDNFGDASNDPSTNPFGSQDLASSRNDMNSGPNGFLSSFGNQPSQQPNAQFGTPRNAPSNSFGVLPKQIVSVGNEPDQFGTNFGSAPPPMGGNFGSAQPPMGGNFGNAPPVGSWQGVNVQSRGGQMSKAEILEKFLDVTKHLLAQL